MTGGFPRGPGVNSASEGRSKRLGPPRNAVQKRSRFGIHHDVPFLSCQPQFESKGRSHYISAPTPIACFVDGVAHGSPRPYPQHSAGFWRTARSLWLEVRLRGGPHSTARVEAEPMFPLANSLVSPVDRRRLLTASSIAGCHPTLFWGAD